MQSEKMAVRLALTQVHAQRRQADVSRQLQEEQLQHLRSIAESIATSRRQPRVKRSAV